VDALLTLGQIREKRLREAQMLVYALNQRILEKKEEIKKAKEALEEYAKKLPELIRQLYIDVLGKKVDVSYVQEKVQLEVKLTQKKQELVIKIKGLEDELLAQENELQLALQNLAKQERKKESMEEVIQVERLKEKKKEERKMNKVIDELASLRRR
jgi:hypothetical protein